MQRHQSHGDPVGPAEPAGLGAAAVRRGKDLRQFPGQRPVRPLCPGCAGAVHGVLHHPRRPGPADPQRRHRVEGGQLPAGLLGLHRHLAGGLRRGYVPGAGLLPAAAGGAGASGGRGRLCDPGVHRGGGGQYPAPLPGGGDLYRRVRAAVLLLVGGAAAVRGDLRRSDAGQSVRRHGGQPGDRRVLGRVRQPLFRGPHQGRHPGALGGVPAVPHLSLRPGRL